MQVLKLIPDSEHFNGVNIDVPPPGNQIDLPALNDRSRFCNTAGRKESRLAHRSTSVDDLAVVTEGGHAQRLSPPKIGSPRASRKESFGSEAPELRDRPAASPPGVASAAPGGHEGA